MLLKSADDKSKRLALLEDLQKSPYLDFQQKKWLREELQRCKKGIQGERESAHYLDSYFKDGENHVVLHDLRFVLDGGLGVHHHHVVKGRKFVETARDFQSVQNLCQDSLMPATLLPRRRNPKSILIVLDGEFTVLVDHQIAGVILGFNQKEMTRAVENQMVNLRYVIIKRPDHAVFDTSFLIKADQFPTWHGKFVQKVGAGTIIKAMFNIRSQETIAE